MCTGEYVDDDAEDETGVERNDDDQDDEGDDDAENAGQWDSSIQASTHSISCPQAATSTQVADATFRSQIRTIDTRQIVSIDKIDKIEIDIDRTDLNDPDNWDRQDG